MMNAAVNENMVAFLSLDGVSTNFDFMMVYYNSSYSNPKGHWNEAFVAFRLHCLEE